MIEVSVPGIYISYPFCSQKCTYCNFASGVFSRETEKRYVDALVRELHDLFSFEWTPRDGVPRRRHSEFNGAH